MASYEHKYLIEKNTRVEIEECLREFSSKLFANHSNLQIVSASGFRSKQGEIEENSGPCIVLYTSCKGVLPYKEKEFPKCIDGIKTDVREGFFYLFPREKRNASSKDILNPLRMGASIGREGDINREGTLGGFVIEEAESTCSGGVQPLYFLTCAHVLFDTSKGIQSYFPKEEFSVVQPCCGVLADKRNYVCGKHLQSVFPPEHQEGVTVDASLVGISARFPKEALFSDLTPMRLYQMGYGEEKPLLYSSGAYRDYRLNKEHDERNNTCIKVGANTGLTRGLLTVNGITAKYLHGTIIGEPNTPPGEDYYAQLEITGPGNMVFSQGGDSGALVFQVDPPKEKGGNDNLVCIGMIVGGTSYHSTVATPICAVLEKLKVQLKKFSE
ncbi:uncharacterized protein LOC134237379 [Saccostrea cucullata]|uniref:uncharacterized protein LOC134237379 n=1 Tax=Saccostrea cuccullata TaxID=36930 RepID=UPI002ED0A722